MEDARGNPPPSAASRARGVGARGRRSISPAFALALVTPRLHDPGGPMPAAGWVLGAGLTVLALAWLLSRPGGRRARRAPKAVWGRRSDEIDLVGAVLGYHDAQRIGPEEDDLGMTRRSLERIEPERVHGTRRGGRRVRHARPTRTPAPRPGPAEPRAARPRLVRERLGFDSPRRPSATTAWLHLVSGATPAETARAACAVAADLIERGGRVLLVDGGRRCLLHARFSREARWGLGECLDGSLPVLGVVQDTGYGGLHLLARGGEPSLSWGALGRLTDEAHSHFEHVLVAIDPDAPREAGAAIAGRLVEGWWAGERMPERNARTLSERLGVVFSAMPIDAESEPVFGRSLGAGARAAAVHAPEPMTPVPLETIVPVAELAPLDVASRSGVALAAETTDPAADALLRSGGSIGNDAQAAVAGELPERWEGPDPAMVLACDGDVRARLEFLMWVRRMTGDAPARPRAWQLADAGVPV